MLKKILIANRGEIAVRILRAAKELGISTVAVHSTADEEAMHVRLADESVCIGPPAIQKSYLNIPAIIAACEITHADAVHPGYGFLSENAQFAEVLAHHDIGFIGPTPQHIHLMGNKIEAIRTAKELGLPCLPGSDGIVNTLKEARLVAKRVGYPLIIKASAGGGGRGMKVVHRAEQLDELFSKTVAEAKAAFNDGSVYIEKFLTSPRHIEVQIIADGKGHAVHLGERDCSIQRRHQKLWEEAGSPVISSEQRETIGEICAKAMQKLNYLGVGTIEFLYEQGQFYFIEMNTRIQVEHPVTEAITDINLINEQISVYSRGCLSFKQEDIVFNGHAIECRINAEDPKTFNPCPGHITQYHPPGGLGVRVDSAIFTGYHVSHYYDSLVAKLIVRGKTRSECLSRLERSLDEFVITGVDTTLPLFRQLIKEPTVLKGDYTIHWLEDFLNQAK